MRVGTRSILFGYHQALLHPWYTLQAWRILYGTWPRWHELAAIITHDLGYWGSRDMDGPEGEAHPERAAAWWSGRFGTFGDQVAAEILGHSRFYATSHGLPLSRLFRADKLAVALYPVWLAMFLLRLSGEIHEYRQQSRDGRYENGDRDTALQWHLEVRAHCTLLGLRGEDHVVAMQAARRQP